MIPLERLLAEELPTGEWGGPRHRQLEPAPEQHPARPRHETTALEAATNRARLETALNQRDGRGTGRPERHLTPVPPLRKAS